MVNINSLPYPDSIKELYNRYYADNGSSANQFISSYWQQTSSRIKVKIGDDGTMREFLGCGFGLAHPTHFLNKFLHYLCDASYLIRLKRRKNIWSLIKKSRSILKSMDAYLSYECFRQLYSLDVIMRHLKTNPEERFHAVMIGDGYGFLSAMVKVIYPQCKVVLADIGKVLFFQLVNLQRIFPKHFHYTALETGEGSLRKDADFIYCPTENLDVICGIRPRLITNIASMQEMTYPVINRYFDYIRRCAAPDNLFYCCNRESKRLPGGEIIDFFRYPWNRDDRHMVDEACNFYRYYFMWKPPFISYFEGPFRHRLSNLKIYDRVG